MGADYEGQEKGIKVFRVLFALPWIGKRAKEFLCHHLRNSLTPLAGNLWLIERDVVFYADPKSPERVRIMKEAVEHIIEDLKKIGC